MFDAIAASIGEKKHGVPAGVESHSIARSVQRRVSSSLDASSNDGQSIEREGERSLAQNAASGPTNHDLLRPGGLFVIYNLSPKRSQPDDERYIPWSDGRCPFDPDEIEAAGFEILAYDVDDTAFARRMARALDWDEQGMDVEGDLFGEYTILRKPAGK